MATDKKEKQPFNVKKFYRRTALIIYDILSVILASALAILVRYELQIDNIPEYFLMPITRSLPLIIAVTLVIFWIFRLYHSLWAFAGETELQNLVIACILSGVSNVVILRFFRFGGQTQAVPNSYYFLYTFFLIACIFASRFSYRFFRSLKHRNENRNNSISVMVIGAGDAGRMVLRELKVERPASSRVVCLVDDNPDKAGRMLDNVEIKGNRNDIPELVRAMKAELDGSLPDLQP